MNVLTGPLLRLPVLTPAVLTTSFALSVVVVLFLSARRIPRWWAFAAGALASGALVGATTLWIVEKPVDLFGTPLGWSTRAWIISCFAVLGLALANARRSTVRRKVAALLGAVVVLGTTVLGVNALYGLNPTVGFVLGMTASRPVVLPVRRVPVDQGLAAAAPSIPLWQSWKAPVGMASRGTIGTAVIPSTVSGFSARPAGVYLPPAALTTNPPALPLVVLLMGQPGNPDPHAVAATLDRYSAAHQGLAPIVIVADQLGDPTVDTLCLDTTRYGKVETYVNTDVIAWARAHLNIRTDRSSWTIAGYSHGGQCAISFAAKHPDLWGNVLDISGEEYPGAEHAAKTLREIFGGDQASYDAQRPSVILSHHHYPDTMAVFTVSTDDTGYIPGVKRVAAAASAAGMHVTYHEVLNGGHGAGALDGGLGEGFMVLYPRLGLSQP